MLSLQPPSSTLPNYLQEDELPQECSDVVSSLPRETGWVANDLHQYQGCWITTRHMKGVLAFQKHFQAHDTDILLVTTPKAGTTWLKAILFALVNRVCYCPYDPQQHPLLTNNPHVLVSFLDITLYTESQVPDLSSFAFPRLFSTHLPFALLPTSVKDSASCKIVYLCRNPKDTFVSLWHFTNKLRPTAWGNNSLEDAFDKFCRGVSVVWALLGQCFGILEEKLRNASKGSFLDV
jgi:hypothetical protein